MNTLTEDEAIIAAITNVIPLEEITKAKGALQKLRPVNGSVAFYVKEPHMLVRCLRWTGDGFKTVRCHKWFREGFRAHEGRYIDIDTPERFKALESRINVS